jgi:hypothetical protein
VYEQKLLGIIPRANSKLESNGRLQATWISGEIRECSFYLKIIIAGADKKLQGDQATFTYLSHVSRCEIMKEHTSEVNA